MKTFPRKITKPLYFAPQSNKAFAILSVKSKSNADFAPGNHRDIVSGAKITTERLFSIIFSTYLKKKKIVIVDIYTTNWTIFKGKHMF